MNGWAGIFRTKRLGVWVVLAVIGLLVALLATGVLSKKEAQQQTTPLTISTSTVVTGNNAVTEFGKGDWGTYGGSFDQNRHSLLTQIDQSNVGTLNRVATIAAMAAGGSSVISAAVRSVATIRAPGTSWLP